jgi:nucleotide-binding universal stress UspA family protein
MPTTIVRMLADACDRRATRASRTVCVEVAPSAHRLREISREARAHGGAALARLVVMQPFRKILVPIDFSPHSDEALRVAGSLAKAFDAPLTMLHVFSPPVYPMPEGAFVTLPAAYAELIDATRTRLEEITAKFKKAHEGVKIDSTTVEGVPFREIITFARKGGHDLIVMGTHGRTGLKHVFLGSVAEKVVRKASCAVLTVRLPGHTFEQP